MTAAASSGGRAHAPLLVLVVVGTIVAGLPVFFLRSTVDPFDTPKLGLLFVGVGLAALLLGVRGIDWPHAATRLVVPAVAVLGPLALATALSPYRVWSLVGSHARYAGLIPYAATVALGVLVAIAFARRVLVLATVLVASVGVVATYALAQMVGADPLEWFSSAYVASTLGHSNFTGALFAMALPLAVGLWSRGGRVAWVGRASAVLVAVALIGSFSQGGLVAALGGCAVTAGGLLATQHRRARAIGYLVAGACAVAVVAAVVLAQISYPSGPFAGGSTWTRGLHWRTAVSMTADAPVVGHGANVYALTASRYRPPVEAMIEGNADDPHSLPLAILAHSGVVGAAGLVLLLLWLARRLRALTLDPIAAGFAGAIVAYLIVSLVTVDQLVLRSLFWVCLGAIVAFETADWGRGLARARASRWIAKAAMLASALALAFFGIGLVRAEIHTARARAALDHGDVSLAASEFDRATTFGGQWEHRRLYGDALGRAGLRNGITDEALVELRRAFEPIVALPEWTWRASFADWLTQWSVERPELTTPARAAWNEVLEVNPHNPRIGIELADLALFEEAPEEAMAALARFEDQLTEWDLPGVPGFPDYWGALAVTRLGLGDRDGALAAFRRAESLAPATCHTFIARILLDGAGLVRRDVRSERLNASFNCAPLAFALVQNGTNIQ